MAKAFHAAQAAISVLVIIFGAAYALRCLLAGQFFCAACFGAIGYACGFRLLLRASIAESKEASR